MKEIGTEGKKFYFEDKGFDTFEELFAYSCGWGDFPLDEETAGKILDRLKRDILFNVFMCGPKMTNREFSNCIEEAFKFAISKIMEKGE